MGNSVTPFDFGTHRVRAILIEDKPWFVVNDVCQALEIANPHNVVARIDGRYLRQAEVADAVGRMRSTNVINESGLYKLVLRSDKPEAEKFQDWITDDVIPQIRETGAYAPKALDDISLMRQMIDSIAADRARVAAVEVRQRELEAKVSAAQGEHREFTTLAYAKLNDLPTDRISCQKHGQRASRLMRQRGCAPRKREDATFGTINVYPADILDETADI